MRLFQSVRPMNQGFYAQCLIIFLSHGNFIFPDAVSNLLKGDLSSRNLSQTAWRNTLIILGLCSWCLRWHISCNFEPVLRCPWHKSKIAVIWPDDLWSPLEVKRLSDNYLCCVLLMPSRISCEILSPFWGVLNRLVDMLRDRLTGNWLLNTFPGRVFSRLMIIGWPARPCTTASCLYYWLWDKTILLALDKIVKCKPCRIGGKSSAPLPAIWIRQIWWRQCRVQLPQSWSVFGWAGWELRGRQKKYEGAREWGGQQNENVPAFLRMKCTYVWLELTRLLLVSGAIIFYRFSKTPCKPTANTPMIVSRVNILPFMTAAPARLRRVTTSLKLLGTTWRAPVTGESEDTGDHMEGREDQIYFRCGVRYVGSAPVHHSAAAFAVTSPRRLHWKKKSTGGTGIQSKKCSKDIVEYMQSTCNQQYGMVRSLFGLVKDLSKPLLNITAQGI